MSHLGSISLDIELDDRTVSAEVPPLEAAFIELFSEQGTSATVPPRGALTSARADEWTVADLTAKLGTIERPAAIKALATWVELGVLKEDAPDKYRLLKNAEAPSASRAARQPAAAVEELPPVVTVQQQQAEQMRVFWKVGASFQFACVCGAHWRAVHRGHAQEPRTTAVGPHTADAQVRAGVRSECRAARRVYGGGEAGRACHCAQRHVEAEPSVVV